MYRKGVVGWGVEKGEVCEERVMRFCMERGGGFPDVPARPRVNQC